MPSQQRCDCTIFHENCCLKRKSRHHMQTKSFLVRLQHYNRLSKCCSTVSPFCRLLPRRALLHFALDSTYWN